MIFMKYNRPIISGIMILIVLNLFFKLPFTEKRLHLDEGIWEKKGIEFVDSVFQHNWKNTRLSTRPAVTIEWIAGIDNLVYQKSVFDKYLSLRVFNRIVFMIIWILFSVLSFLLLCRIFDFKAALFSSVLLALYPGLNNFDGIVWTDIMLMWTQLSAILCFVIYNKNKDKKFLLLSGLFFGFSLLTKIIAWVIPAILLLIAFIQKELNKRQALGIASAAAIGVAVFYILYPASWLDPRLIFDRTTELELAAKDSFSFSVFYYPYSLFYNDPALAVSVLLLIFVAIKDKILIKERTAVYFYLFSFYLVLLTAISYFKDSQVDSIASSRYYIPAIPFLIIFFIQGIYALGANSKYKMVFILPFIIIASYLFNLAFNLYFVIAN